MEESPITVGLLVASGAAWCKLAWDFYSSQAKARGERKDRRRKEVLDDRDDDRDDFEAISEQQAATISRLDARIKRLEDDLDAERQRRLALESDVSTLKLIYRLMRRAVLTECREGTNCPLWRYLDDKERDAMVASLADVRVRDHGEEQKE